MKDPKTVTLEGINFNAAHVAGKDKQAFIDEMMPTKNLGTFDDAKRKELFSKAHDLCKEASTTKEDKAAKAAK